MKSAAEAMELLRSMGGIDAGDARIRHVFMEALAKNGRRDEAEHAAAEARDGLLVTASRIADPEARRSFLERVPENVRLLEVAFEWLGAPSASA
jgi:hypothetical protein